MKTHKVFRVALTSSFFVGLLLGSLSNKATSNLIIYDSIMFSPEKDITLIDCFLKIFTTNIVVGVLVLFLLSYLTGGLLAIFVIFINGFILGKLFLELCLMEQIPIGTKILSTIHIPIEIYSFFLLGFASHDGYYLILDMLKKNQLNNKHFPYKKKLLIPSLMLVLAAIIESIVICYVIL